MTHQPQPGDILVSLTNGAYGDGTRAVQLDIEDEAAGRQVARAILTGPEFARLISGRRVETGNFELALSYFLGGDVGTEFTVFHADTRRIAVRFELDGEQLAAVLGNAVTRVSGARIYTESR